MKNSNDNNRVIHQDQVVVSEEVVQDVFQLEHAQELQASQDMILVKDFLDKKMKTVSENSKHADHNSDKSVSFDVFSQENQFNLEGLNEQHYVDVDVEVMSKPLESLNVSEKVVYTLKMLGIKEEGDESQSQELNDYDFLKEFFFDQYDFSEKNENVFLQVSEKIHQEFHHFYDKYIQSKNVELILDVKQKEEAGVSDFNDKSEEGLDPGPGGDLIDINPGEDILPFVPADDLKLRGSDDADVLEGDSGNDKLTGKSGDDHLDGGLGNDVLSGGSGSDVLIGGEGDDYLNGGTEDDALEGGDGIDKLIGGDGNDIL
ncbi:MAG: calcium-binding protein, partial [Gammaproteobacteria bacterium]